MTSKINMIVSDENRLFREGIRRILSSRRIEITGEVRSLVEVMETITSSVREANLVLCDPSADTESEFEAMSQMTQRLPQLKVVLLTNQMTSEWLDKAVQAGASGFLPKDISADALRFSLELVLLGEQIFPTLHSLLETRVQAAPVVRPNGSADLARLIPLSVRESQILGCLVNGLPNKTIARNLDMAEATVKVHLKALLRKINVRNRTQAAIWGLNNAPRDISERRVGEPYDLPTASAMNGAG